MNPPEFQRITDEILRLARQIHARKKKDREHGKELPNASHPPDDRRHSHWPYEMARWILLKVIDEAEELGRHEDLLGRHVHGKLFPAQSVKFRWSHWIDKVKSGTWKGAEDFVTELFFYMSSLHREMREYTPFYRGLPDLSQCGGEWRAVLELIDSIQFADLPPFYRGRLFEDLMRMEEFAALEEGIGTSSAGRRFVSRYTSYRSLCQFMVSLVSPRRGESVHDPACGSGGLLIDSLKHILSFPEDQGRNQVATAPQALEDIESSFSGGNIGGVFSTISRDLARLDLALHGAPHIKIDSTDFVERHEYAPEEAKTTPPKLYDVILCNSIDEHLGGMKRGELAPAELLEENKHSDPHIGGFFLSIILDRVAPGGRCAVVIPNHYLGSTSTALTKLRKRLINDYNLRLVVSLKDYEGEGYKDSSIIVLERCEHDHTHTHDVIFYNLKGRIFTPYYVEQEEFENEYSGELWRLETEREEDEILEAVRSILSHKIMPSALQNHTETCWPASFSEIKASGYILDPTAYAPVYRQKAIAIEDLPVVLEAEISERRSYLRKLELLSELVQDFGPREDGSYANVALSEIVHESNDEEILVADKDTFRRAAPWLRLEAARPGRGVEILEENSWYLRDRGRKHPEGRAAPQNSILLIPQLGLRANPRAVGPRTQLIPMVNGIPIQCSRNIFLFQCDPDRYNAHYLAWAILHAQTLKPFLSPPSSGLQYRHFSQKVGDLTSAAIVTSLELPIPETVDQQIQIARVLQAVNDLRYAHRDLARDLRIKPVSWSETLSQRLRVKEFTDDVAPDTMKKGLYVEALFRSVLYGIFDGSIPIPELVRRSHQILPKLQKDLKFT